MSPQTRINFTMKYTNISVEIDVTVRTDDELLNEQVATYKSLAKVIGDIRKLSPWIMNELAAWEQRLWLAEHCHVAWMTDTAYAFVVTSCSERNV